MWIFMWHHRRHAVQNFNIWINVSIWVTGLLIYSAELQHMNKCEYSKDSLALAAVSYMLTIVHSNHAHSTPNTTLGIWEMIHSNTLLVHAILITTLCLLVSRQYVFVTLRGPPTLCLLWWAPTLLGRFALSRDPNIRSLFATRFHYLPRFLADRKVFYEVLMFPQGHLDKIALVRPEHISKLMD